jgi:hypothetical protein
VGYGNRAGEFNRRTNLFIEIDGQRSDRRGTWSQESSGMDLRTLRRAQSLTAADPKEALTKPLRKIRKPHDPRRNSYHGQALARAVAALREANDDQNRSALEDARRRTGVRR